MESAHAVEVRFPQWRNAEAHNGQNGRARGPSGSLKGACSELKTDLRRDPRRCDGWRPRRKPEALEDRSDHHAEIVAYRALNGHGLGR